MKQRTKSLPVLVVVAVLALILGSIGTAVAAPAVTKSKVKKIATKIVNKMAPTLTVGNATNLNGQPASTYLTTAYTVNIANVAAVASFDKLLPAIPAGTYSMSLYLTAAQSAAGNGFYCAVYTPGGAQDLIDLYGSQYGSSGPFNTIAGTRIVTIAAGQVVRVFCLTQAGTFTTPASASYGAAQIQFVRLNSATSLGTAPKGNDPSGAAAESGAPVH